MGRKKKKSSKGQDARGYQQQQQQHQEQPRSAAAGGPGRRPLPQQQQRRQQQQKFPAAAVAAAAATPYSCSTSMTPTKQNVLEHLIDDLKQQPLLLLQSAPGSTSAATGERAIMSDRFMKRLSKIYTMLLELQFTESQIGDVVKALGFDITFELALDWFCLHIATTDLPPLFTDGQVRDAAATAATTATNNTAGGSAAAATSTATADLTVIVPVSSNTTTTTTTTAADVETDHIPHQLPPTAATTDDDAFEPRRRRQQQRDDTAAAATANETEEVIADASFKASILAQYQYVDDVDVDFEEDVVEGMLKETQHLTMRPQQHMDDTIDDDDDENACAVHTTTQAALPPPPPTAEEVRLQQLTTELDEAEADLNDEAGCYMKSKHELNDLKRQVKKLRQMVDGVRRKVEQQQRARRRIDATDETVTTDAGITEEDDDGVDDEGECGFGASMFDKDPEPTTNNTPTAGENGTAVNGGGTSSSKAWLVPDDAIPKSWTGKTPRQVLEESCRKQRLPRPTFTQIPPSGCSVIVKRSGRILVDIREEGPFSNQKDAQHYVATKALYELNPELPLYRLLPPFYRDLVQTMLTTDKQNEDDAVREQQQRKTERIEELVRSIPIPQQSASIAEVVKSDIAAEEPEPDDVVQLSWDDADEEEEADAEGGGTTTPKNISKNTSNVEGSRRFARQREGFTRRRHSNQYQTMLKQRKALPMYSFRDDILAKIRDNPVTIISAETGAGKTTQCPQFLLEEALLTDKDVSILCTQPRRVAAISVAERVAEEMCEPSVGKLVGYSIRNETRSSAAETKLTFCTTGIVLRRLVEDPTLTGITHCVIDEVHERQWQIDVLLVTLRKLLTTVRKDLKIILVS